MKMILISFLIIINLITSEIFEDYYEEAEKILKNMTIYEKIGQMFIGSYSSKKAIEQIEKYHVGGFVLFANDLVNHTKEQLVEELEKVQNKSKIKLSFSVDEEGGTVCRVSKYFRNKIFPSPRESFSIGGIEEILKIEKEKRDLLRNLSFNINFAPVADISTNENDYMYNRSLGENASITSEFINAVVDDYVNDNFTCCLKHFPGYGNNKNTHDDVAHDLRPLEYLKTHDLIPFLNAISHNVPMIMVSHNIVHKIDDEYPASISITMHNMLRYEYFYSGLIITDSLSMGAIEKYITDGSAGALAVQAGNDIILTSLLEKHIEQVIEAYHNNTISEKTINTAAKRVIAWKLKYLYKMEIKPKDNPTDTYNEDSDEILYIILGVGIVMVTLIIIFMAYYFYLKKKKNKEKKEQIDNEEEQDPNENRLVRDSVQSDIEPSTSNQ